MKKHYYTLNGLDASHKSYERALESGFNNLIRDLNQFGIIRKISTKETDQGDYKEIKVEFM
jgi:hypothetical protein